MANTPFISIADVADIAGLATPDAERIVDSLDGVRNSRLNPEQARQFLDRRGFRYPKRNIVFHCLKGGASKTTLAYNSAYRLAQLGARVLLVDLDKQANATHSFPVEPVRHCFVDLITKKASVEEAIVPVCTGLDLLPSSLENARLEMELIHLRRNPVGFYAELFAPVRDRYDFLLFDLPPDLNHNTYLSTLFADWIIVPVNADAYSLSGMRMTLDSIQGIQKEYGRDDQEVLVVWSKYDAREKSALTYVPELQELEGARLLPTVVRTDVTFKAAQAKAKSVFELRKRCSAKEDIDQLVREFSGLREYFSPRTGNA